MARGNNQSLVEISMHHGSAVQPVSLSSRATQLAFLQIQMRDFMDEKKQALLCIMQSVIILARARLILQTCAVPLISHIPISAEQPVAESLADGTYLL